MRDLYNTKAQEYEKALFEMTAAIGASMETVPNADKTVIGKIITVYDKKPGTYRVQVENVTFDAITQYNYEYSKDDTVYVTILKGDYSGEKRIVGKVEDLTSELENFYKTNPLKDLVIRAEDSSGCSVDLGATVSNQSFSTTYPTNKNRQIGIEFELQAEPLGAIKIDYNKMAGLLFTLKSGTTAIKPFFISLSELTGNLAYAMEGLPFKVVRDIDTHFDDKGNILSFDKYDVAFINHGAITGGTLTAHIKKFYFGMSADDIAKNTLKVKIGVPAKDENGQETEDIEWSTGSVVQKEVGNIANIGGSQTIHLSLSWQYFDEVKKQIVTFDATAFDNGQEPFANYPQLAANTTITWQKYAERQSKWIDIGEPQSAKIADAYTIEDTYRIAVKPKSGEEGAGYDYDDNYQDYGKLPGQYIEYRAILSFGGIESNTVKFENKFNPTNYIPPVEVGGRNLLLNSGEHVKNSNYGIQSYALAITPTVGETYTITLKGKLGAGKTSFAAYNSGGMVSLAVLDRVGESDLYTKTFTWKNTYGAGTVVSDTHICMYVLYDTTVAESEIEWIKLEKGNIATDWSPAPEDPIEYTNTKVGQFDDQVQQYLSAGGELKIDEEGQYIISPYLGGGYLNITGANSRVIIDPNNHNLQNAIFQVWNNNEMVIGLEANGNAKFDGTVDAKAGNIGGCKIENGKLQIDTAYISSGVFDTARIPDLSAEKITSGTINADQVTISGTLSAAKISADQIIAGRTNATIEFTGAFTAPNATITGTITAKSGYIGPPGGNQSFKIEQIAMQSDRTKYLALHRGLTYNSSTGLYSLTEGQWPVVLCPQGIKSSTSLVQNADASKLWVFLIGKVDSNSQVPFGITDEGYLYATNANISGTITATGGKIGNDEEILQINQLITIGKDEGTTTSTTYFSYYGDNSERFKKAAYGGLNDYYFYLGKAGLLFEDTSPTSIFGGARMHAGGLVVSGIGYAYCNLVDHEFSTTFYGGNGIAFYYDRPVFPDPNSDSTNNNYLHNPEVSILYKPGSFKEAWQYDPSLVINSIWNITSSGVISSNPATTDSDTTTERLNGFQPYGTGAVAIAVGADASKTSWSKNCKFEVRHNGTVYQNGSTIINSWSGYKNSIEKINDKYSILLDNLQPKRYKLNDGTSNRYHIGFILEDVKKALDIAGLSSQECAAYCVDDFETGAGGLRYSEFVALNTHEIQKLKKRVAELEAQLNI